MSLYGDLPPPSTDPEAAASATTPGGSISTPSSAATTPAKAALPAGWSASVTRFKPMLNRKLAPPKPKPARPNIPTGFVIQAEPQLVNTAQASSSSVASLPVQTVYSAAPTVTQPQTVPAVDENSWLKARTAQVQRQDNDHSHNKRQTKRAPAKGQQAVKGQPAPISLDDDYDIARPNEYEEFQGLLAQERHQQAEAVENQRRRGRPGSRRSSNSRSRSRSISQSRSRSYSRSISRSRSRSRSLHRSRSRSRSRRNSSRSPPSSPRRSSLKSSMQRNPRSRSKSPHSQKSRRSRSPMARRGSVSPRSRHSHRRSPSPAKREHSSPRTSQFKSFAPPPPEPSKPTPPTLPIPSSAPVVWADASGEDAFLRRAQLGKQRQMQTPGQNTASLSIAHTGSNSRAQQGAAGTLLSSVILLTNMVGPGEVDDTLQEETAAECEKFGPVVRCLIYEVKNRTVPAEEAVRIFVKFGAAGSAERALRDLDGRFFGGRQVRGQFFDERRFDLLQLAP